MTSEETTCFQILDKYAREHHGCLWTEFLLNKEKRNTSFAYVLWE